MGQGQKQKKQVQFDNLPIFLGPPANSLALLAMAGGGLMAFMREGMPSLSRRLPGPPLTAPRGPPLPGAPGAPGLMAN